MNRKNTVLLAPVQSARDLTVQERSMPKSETLVGNGKGHTGPVHWFQVSISALARFDLWELDGSQENCVVVYASRSQSNQLSLNENGISEAITARTA